jgi:16S rRNA (guanine527-N7)-methyltransferase
MAPKLRERLSQQCEQRGLTLSAVQRAQLLHYLELLLQWRRHLNLTGLHEAERILDVLIVESLDFLQHDLIPVAARVLDLGTGAGVPGIPLAICRPDVQVTLLDRSHKKMAFVRRTVALLRLPGCHPCCDTAETLARPGDPAPRFEIVVARGVGSVAQMLRLAEPLVQAGGKLLLRKPAKTLEIQEAGARLQAGRWSMLHTLPLLDSGSSPWVLLAITRSADEGG